MNNLRPPLLDDIGLVAGVESFVNRFRGIYDITVENETHVFEAEIPDTLKTVIFRIIQEAFNNIAKYSQAKKARLSIWAQDGRLGLLITDDGVGFDARRFSEESSGGGFGLSTMRERVALSGGDFSIDAAPGRGTGIRAEWPLESNARPLSAC